MMKNFTKLSLCAMMIAGAVSVNAQGRSDLLFIAGDGAPSGWELNDATALVATAENANVYTGTVYLKADSEFKFLTTYDFGNDEYRSTVSTGAYPDADGKVALQLNGNDNKIKVSESANYLITVDTEALTATIVKSAYQDTQINFCSLFMVGGATATGWERDKAHTMKQDVENPYVFKAEKEAFVEGTFKITWAIKGDENWSAKYWYFKDPTDETKMVLGAQGDNQWNITSAGNYDVIANVLDNTISIKSALDGVVAVEAEAEAAEAVYYNMQGVRVANPAQGQLVIKVANGKAQKVVL
ncbi:MAG: SusF/SusE family outer membrane protein [Bacteroidales bacterium]|nr:SusF/SusE family outer membrane protein [Bacteroidales bacterium]